MTSKQMLTGMLLLASLYAVTSCVAMAGDVERWHMDAKDIPLATPDGQVLPACVIDLHSKGVITTAAYIGYCKDMVPVVEENMRQSGDTKIITLRINGVDINLS